MPLSQFSQFLRLIKSICIYESSEADSLGQNCNVLGRLQFLMLYLSVSTIRALYTCSCSVHDVKQNQKSN